MTRVTVPCRSPSTQTRRALLAGAALVAPAAALPALVTVAGEETDPHLAWWAEIEALDALDGTDTGRTEEEITAQVRRLDELGDLLAGPHARRRDRPGASGAPADPPGWAVRRRRVRGRDPRPRPRHARAAGRGGTGVTKRNAASVVRVDFARGRPVPADQPRRGLANDMLLHELRLLAGDFARYAELHREVEAAVAHLVALLEARHRSRRST